MLIRNNDELKEFEETLGRCGRSVLLLTSRGEQYDLKNPAERYIGIAEMLQKDGADEPELFATSTADESLLLRYFALHEEKTA